MKAKIVIAAVVLLWCAAAVGQAAPQAEPFPSAQAIPEDAGAKKARAVLDQMLKAMGGEAFLSYQDMSQQGRTARFYKGVPQGSSMPYWSFWKWKDKERIELTKQRDVAYVYNGEDAYEITYKGTRILDADDLNAYRRNREHALQTVLRVWLKQPGTLLFHEGTAIVDQKQVDKITVMNAKNESVTLAVDTFTHLLVSKSYQWREPDTRYFNDEAEIYGNYHQVQGIQTPRNVTMLHNGDVTRQRFIDTTAYNTGLPDAQFEASATYNPFPEKKQP